MVALAEIPFCHKATTGGRAKPGKAINAVAFCTRRACEKNSSVGGGLVKRILLGEESL